MSKAQYVRRCKDYKENKAGFGQLGVLAGLGVVILGFFLAAPRGLWDLTSPTRD